MDGTDDDPDLLYTAQPANASSLETVVLEEPNTALAASTALESLVANIPSLREHATEHAIISWSILFVLLALLFVMLAILAARRSTLRRARHFSPRLSETEWAPINRAEVQSPDMLPSTAPAPGPPHLQLPALREPTSYNTFAPDGDAAWQAAKADWHAAIAAARRLHDPPTGPGPPAGARRAREERESGL